MHGDIWGVFYVCVFVEDGKWDGVEWMDWVDFSFLDFFVSIDDEIARTWKIVY